MLHAWFTFKSAPLAYLTIPVCAALVGYGTNWVGVKMIFYPIGFWGVPIRRWEEQPLGLIGWQGIVPCKVKKMSTRLVDIVTEKLLSLKEAFSRLDADKLAELLEPSVAKAIEKDTAWGEIKVALVRPQLRAVLRTVVRNMQADIDSILDLRQVVQSAFLRDKVLLGELFQKAGRKELKFLVDSGLSFGFVLGIIQMWLWILKPAGWVLPVGGALVGYITNWVAIKLIFDPVEPTPIGPFVFQGLFEKRQPEVSGEFSEFLAQRVLTSPRLIDEIVNGRLSHNFEAMAKAAVPSMTPEDVPMAAVGELRRLAAGPHDHPVHLYVNEALQLQDTLNIRLRALTSAEFEDLLHPVFEEDEVILIVAGGVLGAAAGFVQMFFGWGGPEVVAESAAAAAVSAAGGAMAGGAAALTTTKAMMLLPPPALALLGKGVAAIAYVPRRLWSRWQQRRRRGRGDQKVMANLMANDASQQWRARRTSVSVLGRGA